MPNEKTMILVKDAFAKIKERDNKDDFNEDGKPRLKPIFEELDSKVSYDDIRIALF